MATSNSQQSFGLQCCQVCYQEYSDEEEKTPRVLQCGHTFCTGCLAKLQASDSLSLVPGLSLSATGGLSPAHFAIVSSTRSRDLKCPGCKQPHPRNQAIPKNYQLLGLQQQAAQSPRDPDSISTLYFCEEHQKEKDVYCRDDSVVVCPFCVLYGEHRTHNTIPAVEVCQSIKETLKENGETLVTFLVAVSKAHSDIQRLVEELEENKKYCYEKISHTVDEVCRELQKRKERELSDLNQFCEEQAGILTDQLRALEETKKDCEEQLHSCRSLSKATPAAVLTEHKVVLDTSQQLCGQMADQPLKPIVKPIIQCPRLPAASALVNPVWTQIEAMFGQNEEEVEEEEEEVKDREKMVELEEEREEGDSNVTTGGRRMRNLPALKGNTMSLPVPQNEQANVPRPMAGVHISPTSPPASASLPPAGQNTWDGYDEAEDLDDIFTT